MLDGDCEIQTIEQFSDLVEKSGKSDCRLETVFEYLECKSVSFDLVSRCARDIQQFTYLNIDLQKVRSFIHDAKNEKLYMSFLGQLVDQRVRNEVLQSFTKLDVPYYMYERIRKNQDHKRVLYLYVDEFKCLSGVNFGKFTNLTGLMLYKAKVENGFFVN